MAHALPHAIGAATAFPGRQAHRGPSLVDVRTDPDALSIPPHITGEQVRGFALAGMRTVLSGGLGKMVTPARANLRSVPRHPLRSGATNWRRRATCAAWASCTR